MPGVFGYFICNLLFTSVLIHGAVKSVIYYGRLSEIELFTSKTAYETFSLDTTDFYTCL